MSSLCGALHFIQSLQLRDARLVGSYVGMTEPEVLWGRCRPAWRLDRCRSAQGVNVQPGAPPQRRLELTRVRDHLGGLPGLQLLLELSRLLLQFIQAADNTAEQLQHLRRLVAHRRRRRSTARVAVTPWAGNCSALLPVAGAGPCATWLRLHRAQNLLEMRATE
jgi:hypothetical protein